MFNLCLSGKEEELKKIREKAEEIYVTDRMQLHNEQECIPEEALNKIEQLAHDTYKHLDRTEQGAWEYLATKELGLQ